MVVAARNAGKAWAELGVKERTRRLAGFSDLVLSDVDAICSLISRTTGKVLTEALLGEIIPSLDLARFYQRRAAGILRDRNVPTSLLSFPAATARISRKPYGVVAVISPWNYPFQITVSIALTALYAGNAVILKMSELSLPVGELLLSLFARLGLPNNLVQWVIGDGESGEQLIDARPDLVVFTGSLNTGRAVMRRAAQHPIPVILELGGKDAMVVFDDADLARACDAALYGAFSNNGQACVSVERLYVQRGCFDAFVRRLVEGVGRLQLGYGDKGDLGVMTSARQMANVQRQYDDAVAKGAKVSGLLQIKGNFLYPVVCWNVNSDMLLIREETFGPLLPVIPFDDEEEAIRLTNNSIFGLNASVWSRDVAKAEWVAARLEVGNWAVNDVLKNIGHPALPFGGIKSSGFGRYRGAEGLRQFTCPVSGVTSRSTLEKEPNWFPYSRERYENFKGYLDFVFGSKALFRRMWWNRVALLRFHRFLVLNLKQCLINVKQLFCWNRDY